MPPRLPLSALVLAGALASCGAPSASVTPFIASVGINGELSIAQSMGSENIKTTFKDLGLDENEAAVGGILRVGFGGTELSVSGYGVDFQGQGRVTGEFNFEGITIPAGADVATDLGIQMARAMVTWDVIPLGALDLGLGIGATVVDFDVKLQEIGGPNRIETNQLIPIPLLAARLAWTWGPVEMRADVGGLGIRYEGVEAAMIDAGINASVDFFGIGDLVVGFKTMRVDAQYEDDDADIDTDFDLEGFYAGLRLGF
ncbi:MAG: hypothetical protein AAGI22_04500 [Planctomycetota bacterium]